MSCNIDIDVKVNIHVAAIVREALFLYTKQDSYEFPGQRTVAIRSMIPVSYTHLTLPTILRV